MPAEYRIERSRRMVLSRAWGCLTDAELTDNRAALFADAAFEPDMAQLYDFSGVTELKVTSETLRLFARTSRFSPRARRAMVVSSDAVFGMARMYAIMSDKEDQIQVFRDVASAMHWLDSAMGG